MNNKNNHHSTMASQQGPANGTNMTAQANMDPNGGHGGGLLYDVSSFDPLQQHAFQLTASAGLTNLLTASGAPPNRNGDNNNGMQTQQPLHHHHQQQQQQQIPQHQQVSANHQQVQIAQRAPTSHQLQPPQQQQQQQQPPQNNYYYIPQQQNGVNTSNLQPIAPATQQTTAAPGMPQAAAPPAALQSFLLSAGAPGATALAVPPNFQSQLFANGLPGAPVTAAPGTVLPNFLMGHPFQTLIQQQQPPQQLQLQPQAQQQPQQQQPPPQQQHHQLQQQQQPQLQQQSQQIPQQTATHLALAMVAPKREAETSAAPENAKKKRELAPSVVSSSVNSSESTGTGFGSSQNGGGGGSSSNNANNLWLDKPPTEKPQAVLDKMSPAERRRYERNLREQQRSYRISQQIKELRDVLAESNVPFKPNKYSILLSVVEYIKQLQSRAIMLDSEHQKLITTIRQTNEMVNSGNTPSSADETEATNTSGVSDLGSDNEMLFVQGLDYRSVFDQCPAALGVAALDGRILECNSEFQVLLGFERDELLKQSLFNLVRNHQDIFRAMAEMLKTAESHASGPSNDPNNPNGNVKHRCWSGPVVSKRDNKLSMNLTLTMGDDGLPKFFNCALSTV